MKSLLKSSLALAIAVMMLVGLHMDVEAEAPALEAEAAILVDAETGEIVYQDNIDTSLPPASMSKMMAEYLVHQAIDEQSISWEDEVEISSKVAALSIRPGLANVPLRESQSYTVEELYEAMAVDSANGATVALAEHLAGSERAFVDEMNAKAEQLGMSDYKFVNASGLNNTSMAGEHPSGTGADEENMMSARDTAILAYNLLNDYPEILEIASEEEVLFGEGTNDEVVLENWNWMLPGFEQEYEGVDGLKTGSTNLAGNAFTGTLERDERRYISVVMRTESRNARFTETAKLYDYGFDVISENKYVEEGESLQGSSTLPVSQGRNDEVAVVAGDNISAYVEEGGKEPQIDTMLDSEKVDEEGNLQAPVKKGDVVGTIRLQTNGTGGEYLLDSMRVPNRVPLIADETIEEATWFSSALDNVGGLFNSIRYNAGDWMKNIL